MSSGRFRLGFMVFVGVMFPGFVRVMAGMRSVAVRRMRMMRAFFVAASVVVLSRFPVMMSSTFVVLGSFGMVLCALVLHGVSSSGLRRLATIAIR
jgi:hypothetical protein